MQLISALGTAITALFLINGISAVPPHQASNRDVARLQARGDQDDYEDAKKKVEKDGKVVNMDDVQFVEKDKDIGSFTFAACMGAAILGKEGSLLGHWSCFSSGNDWRPAKDIPDAWKEHEDKLKDDTKTYVYAQQKEAGGDYEDEGRLDELKKIVKDTTGKDPEVIGYLTPMAFMDDYGKIKKEYNGDKVFSLKGGMAAIHKSTLGIDRDGPADIFFYKSEDMEKSCKA